MFHLVDGERTLCASDLIDGCEFVDHKLAIGFHILYMDGQDIVIVPADMQTTTDLVQLLYLPLKTQYVVFGMLHQSNVA